MATLKWKYERDGDQDVLVAHGEFSKGWQRWKGGRGYFGRAVASYKRGLSLRVDIQIWGMTESAGLNTDLVHPPDTLSDDMRLSFGRLVVSNGLLELKVPVEECVTMAESRSKRYIRDDMGFRHTRGGVQYRFTVAVQVLGDSPSPLPVKWESGEPGVFSGGLPETNRRRH